MIRDLIHCLQERIIGKAHKQASCNVTRVSRVAGGPGVRAHFICTISMHFALVCFMV